jgi:transcriptional regulator with XRE-family HTH domain
MPNFSSKNDEKIIANMLQIHKKIEAERIKAGLTQDEVAEKLGIKRSTYQYWEKKTPGVDKLKQVAKVLGKPESYFLNGDDENFGTQQKTDYINTNSLPGTATLQDLLNEKDQRIKDIETSRQKIESLLAEANEEKRQLIATLRENMRLQEQQLKTMEANLVRGHDEIKGLLFSSNKYWEDVLIGEVGLLSGKRKVVGKKAGISRPGK